MLERSGQQSAAVMEPPNFQEAAQKLAAFDIREEQIYLIDLVFLAEMAWADGTIQSAERELILSYLNHHVDSINRLAGCTILSQKEAKAFVTRLLEECPSPELLEVVKDVISVVRFSKREPEEGGRIRLDILNACLDIAASSVTKYPYGLSERFTEEEKTCYHRIEAALQGRSICSRRTS